MTQTVLLGDLLEISKVSINPLKLPEAEFNVYSIPGYDIGSSERLRGCNIKSNKFVVHDQTILVSKLNPRIPRVWKVEKALPNAISSTEFVVLRLKPGYELLYNYLFAVMTSSSFSSYLQSRVKGTSGSHQRIKPEDIYHFPITIEDAHSVRVGNFIASIDEKIELNRKMNETLEQMGQALFRYYFIDNSEAEKWEEKLLGDFVELVNGTSYKSAELKPSKNALVTLKSVGRGGGFNRRGYKEFTGKMKDMQVVHDGDLVVAHTDLTQKAEVAGYPAIVDGTDQYNQVAISMDLVKVIPRSNELSSSVVYFLLKTREFQDHKMGYISGSTVLHLNKKCIPSYELTLPSDEVVLRTISSEFDDIMEKIKNNNQQIQTLTTLRDTLLPRLINGKIKV